MSSCSNPLEVVTDAGNCVIGAIVGGQLEQFAAQVTAGFNDLWTGFYTSWIQAPLDGVIGGVAADWFKTFAIPVQVLLLMLGLMVAGIRMALMARGEPAADAARKFFRAILITIAGTAGFQILLLGCNALAKYILDSATGSGAPGSLTAMTAFASNVALALIFGIFGLIIVGIQWVLMAIRGVALTVLVPFWPIAASGAMFEKHEGMFEKVTGWLLAFALYSPVAAALYGMAIKLQQGTDGVEGVMYGLGIFILALVALPALMRLVVPLSSAMGRAGAGAMTMTAVRTAVTAGVAVGAVVATGGAAAPVAAGSGAVAGGGSAAAGSAGATGAAGSAGATGAGSSAAAAASGPAPAPAGAPTGAESARAPASQGAGSSSGSSARSGWDSARDLTNGMPRGSHTSVGETFDE